MVENKNVEDSLTEWTRVLRYEDINGQNRLFGGRLLAWIDEIAGTVAMRHAGKQVTTAAIDNLQFKQGAALNDMVVMIGKLTHVGKTSMEVRVDSYVEDSDGFRHVINRAYLTLVCLDDDGKPKQVPYGLNVRTESEKAEWEGAEKRIELRKTRRTEGF